VELAIHKDYKDVRLPRAKLNLLFKAVVNEEIDDSGDSTVNLVFTNDDHLRQLNSRHRSKNRPTDVLSFNIDDPDTPGGIFGEIYISVDTANRQAEAYGGTPAAEYLRLTCHGLLHLCGYDHQDSAHAAHMKSLEDRYLSQVEGNGRV
jgi:probable rRNA maturation factor